MVRRLEVDKDRLRGAGMSTDDQEILAELDALRDGRLSLQSRDHWLPVRNLKVRQG